MSLDSAFLEPWSTITTPTSCVAQLPLLPALFVVLDSAATPAAPAPAAAVVTRQEGQQGCSQHGGCKFAWWRQGPAKGQTLATCGLQAASSPG
jgi:hypothetical protein